MLGQTQTHHIRFPGLKRTAKAPPHPRGQEDWGAYLSESFLNAARRSSQSARGCRPSMARKRVLCQWQVRCRDFVRFVGVRRNKRSRQKSSRRVRCDSRPSLCDLAFAAKQIPSGARPSDASERNHFPRSTTFDRCGIRIGTRRSGLFFPQGTWRASWKG